MPDAGTAGRVIVVGAGLAGLTAAHDLRDDGLGRRGARGPAPGRWTRAHGVTTPFTGGLHAEGGGESIDDNHDRIQALITRFGLQTERRLAEPGSQRDDRTTAAVGLRRLRS